MARALDRYTSGKDVAYRFVPGWLLTLVVVCSGHEPNSSLGLVG